MPDHSTTTTTTTTTDLVADEKPDRTTGKGEHSDETGSATADVEETQEQEVDSKTDICEGEKEFLKQKEQPRSKRKRPVSGDVFADTELAYKHFTGLLGRLQHEVLHEDRYDLHEVIYESLANLTRLLAQSEIKTKEMRKKLVKVKELVPNMPEMDDEGNYVSG
ncbi:hypothetical protein MBLNU13_g05332t1 [Cladosporium sp. NU13]